MDLFGRGWIDLRSRSMWTLAKHLDGFSLGRRMLRSLRASGGGISLLKVRTTFR